MKITHVLLALAFALTLSACGGHLDRAEPEIIPVEVTRFEKEREVRDCVAELLKASADVERASGVMRTTKACSHIYGLVHDRRLTEFRILTENDGDVGPVDLDGESFLPADLLREAVLKLDHGDVNGVNRLKPVDDTQ